MRSFVVPLVCILLFACASDSADAQAFPSPVGLGLPSLGGSWGGGECEPLCDPHVGGGLAFNIGYLATDRNAAFDLSADPLVGSVASVRHDFPVDGLWLAVSASGRLRDGFGIFARGSWLVPSNRRSDRTLVFGGTPEPGRWRTRVQWYNADIAGTFSPYGALTVVGGFRFDSFDMKFHDRDLVDPDDLGTDETNVTVSSYIPYVGVMVHHGSELKVGLIGFPYVPGDVSYDHTWGPRVIRHDAKGSFRTGYFLEAFAEYGRQLMGGYVGVFGTWTCLHGSSELDVARTIGGGAATGGVYQFSTDRKNWIFGGKLEMNFASPI